MLSLFSLVETDSFSHSISTTGSLIGSLCSSVDSSFTSGSVDTSLGFSNSSDGEGVLLGSISWPVSDGVLISC